MELRHLRYFVAVAEELHFGRAAERLHMSQPPLSQQIREFEEELQVKLFLRHHRRIELTQAGRVFLVEAQQILSQMERAVEAVKRAERGQVGSLVLACGPLAVHNVLPRFLTVFRARFPEIEITLRELTAMEIIEALRTKTVDVGLLMPSFESKMLKRQIILTVPIVAALPKIHPLAGRRRLRIEQLAQEHFVFFSQRFAPGFYEHTIALCRRAGFTPKVAQEAAQHPTLLALVAAGYGVSLIPALGKPAAPEGVVFVRVEQRWATIQLWMAWMASNSSPVLSAFVEVVRACCTKATKKKSRSRK